MASHIVFSTSLISGEIFVPSTSNFSLFFWLPIIFFLFFGFLVSVH